MTKLNPVYAPPGYDPTREEFPLARPGCGGFVLIALLIVALATDGFAFLLSKQKPAQAQGIPTIALMPSSTHRKETSSTPNGSATVRAFLTRLPPIPSATNTATPSITFTASQGPSPTASGTPTRTPTRTPRPLPTKRPARPAPRTSGNGNESQPPATDNPQNAPAPTVMIIITVWAPPIRATCCKPLEPAITWTPINTIIPPTATASPTPRPTLPAPTATIPPSETSTAIPASSTPSPTITAIPSTATQQPSPTIQPSDESPIR